MDLVNVGSGNVGGYAIWRGWKIILDAGFLKVFFFSDSVCVFIGRRDTYKCMSSKRRQFAFC